MFHQLSVLKEKISKSSLNQKTRSENLVVITIPAAGVEPARPCGHWILRKALAVLQFHEPNKTSNTRNYICRKIGRFICF